MTYLVENLTSSPVYVDESCRCRHCNTLLLRQHPHRHLHKRGISMTLKLHQISTQRDNGNIPAYGRALVTDGSGGVGIAYATGLAVGRVWSSATTLSAVSSYSFYPGVLDASSIYGLFLTGGPAIRYENNTSEKTTFLMEVHLNVQSAASNASLYVNIGMSSGTYTNPVTYPTVFYYSPSSQPNSGVASLLFSVLPGNWVQPTIDINVTGAANNTISPYTHWRLHQIS